jgi:SAM-dependent methyltransferase
MKDSAQSAHVARQRRFYDEREHTHLQADDSDYYVKKSARRVADSLGLQGHERVLEVGAGFGRFTFALLERCASVVALDLSHRTLESLERGRDERGISEARCTTVRANVDEFASQPCDPGERFDAIVGFFFLHHLPDFEATIPRLAPHLAPGGRMSFLEPNRANPLFALQVATCPDMNWNEEKGLFGVTQAKVEGALSRAELEEVATERYGFFPPPLLNRAAWARRMEERLESTGALQPLLPLLLFSGKAPAPR